jgi:hypothetical protein
MVYIDSEGRITADYDSMTEIIWAWIKYKMRRWL